MKMKMYYSKTSDNASTVPAPLWRGGWGRYQKLQLATIVTSLFHFAQAMAVLCLNNNVDIPMRINLQLWPTRGSQGAAFMSYPMPAGSLSLEGAIAAFFLLSFVFQFGAVTVLWETYQERLQSKAMQPYRFLEYSVSASLMTIIFAVLFGIQQADYIVVLFVGQATVMLLGLLQEYQIVYKRALKDTMMWWEFFMPHAIGWLLFTAIVSIFIIRFVLTVNKSLDIHHAKPPQWVYAIIATQMLFFSSFGFNQTISQCRIYMVYADVKECANIAIQHEYVYIGLSIGAKSSLAWILYANMLAVEDIKYT